MKRSVTKKPKLTKWFDGSKFVPYHVGEYNASLVRNTDHRRWWDGKKWSVSYFEWEPEEIKDIFKKMKINWKYLEWRGLAQNPEVQP